MKKKVIIIITSVILTILLLVGIVFIVAAIKGRKLKVNPDKNLEGVDEVVCNALWYSSLTANSHNSQPWKVKIYPNEEAISITLDQDRLLNVVDPFNREAYISLGCYLSTMEYSFNACGFDTSVTCSMDEDGIKATLKYSLRDKEINQDKVRIIDKRHTNKSKYKKEKISNEDLEILFEKYSDIICYQREQENFEYLRMGTIDAVEIQSADQEYRDELAEWLRFSDSEAEKKLDGISADMMGLKGVVKSFYYWTTTRSSAKKDKFAEQGIDTIKKQVNNCGAFFVITGGNNPLELVKVGRKTQSFWFDCTSLDIAIQPVSAMLEVPTLSAFIQTDLKTSQSVQMILRAGYVSNYGYNSGLRRNLNDYIDVIK